MATRIVFFGNERLATGLSTDAPILQGLIAAGYEIAALVVAQKATGASRKARNLEIVDVAEAHGIEVIAPEKLKDAKDQLANFGAEIGVLVAYGKIVPQEIINVFPRGIVNIHPSLLPLHRGSTPIESVMLSDERQTGVSLMSLTVNMDSGPVYAQQIVQLSGNETKQTLADTLVELGKTMLLEHLPSIIDDSLKPYIQDEKSATYDMRIDKSVSELDFNKPADKLQREVRAFAGWPRSHCKIGLTNVIISAAHVIEGTGVPGTLWLNGKEIGVHSSNGILVFDRIIPAGKKEMDAAAFLTGYQL